jgi:ubiquinone/menaquinone biosynthesis C-methylase UbiE
MEALDKMFDMKRANSTAEIFTGRFSFKGKAVADVGCGTGDLVRWLAGRGAAVVGVDKPKMLAKAESFARAGDERYIPGSAEELPLPDKSVDILIYAASFHHVSEARRGDALKHCRRVIKPGGNVVFIEPVAQPGAYTEITHLAEDEAETQQKAYEVIRKAPELGFELAAEEFYFVERSFEDFISLINTFTEDEEKRPEILARARDVTERFAREAGVHFEDFRYPSILRLNILRAL